MKGFVQMKQILALDINREYYELGLPVIEKAGVAHKIDFREGPALPLLDQLIKEVSSIHPSYHYFEEKDVFVVDHLCGWRS